MDIVELVKSRRSIRKFKEDAIPARILEAVIDAARWAPSAGNVQPWEFVVVKKPETKIGLVEAALDQKFIGEAPTVIVVCADENRAYESYGTRGKTLYCIQDTAAAIMNLHLAACALGLATCWIGAFKEEKVRETLRVPEGIRPVAIIPLGYAAEAPNPRRRRPIGEIVHEEVF